MVTEPFILQLFIRKSELKVHLTISKFPTKLQFQNQIVDDNLKLSSFKVSGKIKP